MRTTSDDRQRDVSSRDNLRMYINSRRRDLRNIGQDRTNHVEIRPVQAAGWSLYNNFPPDLSNSRGIVDLICIGK